MFCMFFFCHLHFDLLVHEVREKKRERKSIDVHSKKGVSLIKTLEEVFNGKIDKEKELFESSDPF